MSKYRKKPIVIEAYKFNSDESVPDWFTEALNKNIITIYYVNNSSENLHYECLKDAERYCIIKTMEGEMRGNKGDFIIKGVKGEIYACNPEIFEISYEKVKDE